MRLEINASAFFEFDAKETVILLPWHLVGDFIGPRAHGNFPCARRFEIEIVPKSITYLRSGKMLFVFPIRQ